MWFPEGLEDTPLNVVYRPTVCKIGTWTDDSKKFRFPHQISFYAFIHGPKITGPVFRVDSNRDFWKKFSYFVGPKISIYTIKPAEKTNEIQS